MLIEQIGITYDISQEFDNYTIKGKILEYNDDTFSCQFSVIEGDEGVLDFIYTFTQEDNYVLNYISKDKNKIKQYQSILFNLVLDAFDEIDNQRT